MRTRTILTVSVALLAALPACAPSSSLRVASDQASMAPPIATAVYRLGDENTADIYLSDVPADALLTRLEQGPDGPPATVVHINMFLLPKAGRTPIDFTASNMTITMLVLPGSGRGVYGGGGFMLPSTGLGDAQLRGRIDGATLRLIEQEGAFADRLGLSELSGRVAAQRDDELAEAIGARMTYLLIR